MSGPRITVELIVKKVAYGAVDEILLDYPQLTHEPIYAGLRFAAHTVQCRYSRKVAA